MAEVMESGEDQVNAISRLPANLAVIRMEMDAITSLAAARPRDMMAIRADLEGTLAAFPEMAEEAIYNKPVGKVSLIDCKCGYQYEATSSKDEDMKCPSCSKVQVAKSRQVQKYARGLSVKAAEALAEAYGFNSVKADVEIVDADTVKVVGVFIDYQRGTRREFSSLVSRWYKGRGGAMVRHADDRFAQLVVKAEQSKVVREAITRSVNAGMKQWFFDRCEKIQDTLLDDVTAAKMISEFATKNVSLEMLGKLLGKPKSAGWTKDDRKTLVGVWSGLKTGETTVQELFHDDPAEPSAPPSAKGAVSGDSIGSAKTTGSAPFPAGGGSDKPEKSKTPKGSTKPAKSQETEQPSVAAELQKQIGMVTDLAQGQYVKDEIAGALARGSLLADEAGDLQDHLAAHMAALK